MGLLLIIFAAVGFLNMENASGFFVMVFGLGVLMNGCLAGLSFLRKKYILAAVLAVLAAALLVLFIRSSWRLLMILRSPSWAFPLC